MLEQGDLLATIEQSINLGLRVSYRHLRLSCHMLNLQAQIIILLEYTHDLLLLLRFKRFFDDFFNSILEELSGHCAFLESLRDFISDDLVVNGVR